MGHQITALCNSSFGVIVVYWLFFFFLNISVFQ